MCDPMGVGALPEPPSGCRAECTTSYTAQLNLVDPLPEPPSEWQIDRARQTAEALPKPPSGLRLGLTVFLRCGVPLAGGSRDGDRPGQGPIGGGVRKVNDLWVVVRVRSTTFGSWWAKVNDLSVGQRSFVDRPRGR